MSDFTFSKHWIFGLLMLCTGCQNETTEVQRVRSWSDEVSRILELMTAQEAAWNRGDLEGFMLPYWKSDSLLFVGSNGPSRGWSTTLENYKRSYPDKAAMGKLTFGVESTEPAGPDHALMLGSWRLDRSDGFEPLFGWFSLVWERRDGDWVIVRDHSS